MTDPSPARVAAERGRSERRNADRWHPNSTQPAEPASPVPAPTLDGQRDAESRDLIDALVAELLQWQRGERSTLNTMMSVESGPEQRQQTLVATAQADAAEVAKIAAAIDGLRAARVARGPSS